MIRVHMIKDSGLLYSREGVRPEELGRFQPVDLSESTDESKADGIDSVKGEIMRVLVLTRFGKMTKVTVACPALSIRNRYCVSNYGQTPA